MLPKKLRRIESTQALQHDGGGHTLKLQSVFPSIKGNCSKNTEVLKHEVERGEEAMTGSKGLSYPKTSESHKGDLIM